MKEPKDYLSLEPIEAPTIKSLNPDSTLDSTQFYITTTYLSEVGRLYGYTKDTVREATVRCLLNKVIPNVLCSAIVTSFSTKMSSVDALRAHIEGVKQYNEIALKIKNNIIEGHLNQNSSKGTEIETAPTVSAAASAANVPVNFQTVVGDPVRQPQQQMVMPEYMKAYQNNNAYDPAINPFYQAAMQQVSQPQAQPPQHSGDEIKKLKDISKKYILNGYDLNVSVIQLKKLISLLDNNSFINELRNQGCCTNRQIKHLKFSKFYKELLEKHRVASDTTNYTNVFSVPVEKLLPGNKDRKGVIYINLQEIKTPQDKIKAIIVTYEDTRKEG